MNKCLRLVHPTTSDLGSCSNPKQKKGIQVVQFLGLCIPQFRNLTDGPTGGRAFFHDQPIGHTHTSSTVAQSWLTLEARSAGQDMGLDFTDRGCSPGWIQSAGCFLFGKLPRTRGDSPLFLGACLTLGCAGLRRARKRSPDGRGDQLARRTGARSLGACSHRGQKLNVSNSFIAQRVAGRRRYRTSLR